MSRSRFVAVHLYPFQPDYNMAGGHGSAHAGAGRKSKGAQPDSVAYGLSVQDATGKFAIKSKGVGLGSGVHGFFSNFNTLRSLKQ